MIRELKKSPNLLLLGIIAVGIFIRVYKLSQIGYLHSDSLTFLHSIRIAYENMITHGLFSTEFLSVLIRPPDGAYAVYGKISHVLFHFMFYSIFKDTLTSFLYLNVFWSVLTIGLTFYIGKTFFSEKAGLIAALLLSVSAFDTQYARSFLSHSGASFFVLLSVYFYLRRLSSPQIYKYLLFTGLSLGAAVTFHGTTLYFLPALMIFEALHFSLKSNIFKQGLGFISKSFCLGITTGAPLIFFEAIGLLFARQSFLYNFFLVKARHGHYPSDLSPLYVLQQYMMSHGSIFFLLTVLALVGVGWKAFQTRNLKYAFILFFPLFFFSYWTFSQASLNSYFRYLVPIFPCISIGISIFLADLLNAKNKVQTAAISTMVVASVFINLNITRMFVNQSQNWNAEMIKTLKEKNVGHLYLTSTFFKSYLSILHPKLSTQIKITQISTHADLKGIKPASGTYALIDGITFIKNRGLENAKAQLISKASHTFSSPFLTFYPLLFQITHDGADLKLLDIAQRHEWVKKTYWVELSKVRF